ncbi:MULTISPECIES: outer membrane protein assembly factor BamD [Pseudidiomarina]|uniref:Outer membrane protein assembly factor BamD n=3 Tax=Pseudidiomarina TaxID=2800384 RepID=A0A368UQT9_9GAMM|nr:MULTISPECIES: outer membrane protein assembly factor BamD [Pseudidiomarina]PWW12164.1 Beta-barrel assembly machine subunit BamD [Pseudidiomarina maritima]RBP89349.1 Beta-barrel assembly machine subunit BamD [Pseudidiomarina tainanensis]RCW31198.1 Beta-barrel assembly machine subunit BamD [Pseudidiomarina tainanensis]
MKLRLILACAAVIAVSACSGTPDDQFDDSRLSDVEKGYERAKSSLANGNINNALQILESINMRYPFGPLTHQIQLDLIYAYYKVGNLDKALATIDRFVRLNPNHQDYDYALYMRGLTNQRTAENTIQEFFGVDRADRDPTKTREAFDDFAELVRRFPDSKYAADARQRMVAIKSTLAQYELAVAQYYVKREAYLSAANRGKYVLENFPDTAEAETALIIMANSYEQLNLDQLQQDTVATLQKNFPNSRYFRRGLEQD